MSNHPVHASNLLGMYQELYDIEDRGKLLDAAGLLELRVAESTAVWSRIGDYLNSDGMANVLPKEQFGKAIGYLRGNWTALQVYVSNASVSIDNNETEQLMKQVAVGRNYAELRADGLAMSGSERPATPHNLVTGDPGSRTGDRPSSVAEPCSAVPRFGPAPGVSSPDPPRHTCALFLKIHAPATRR